MTGQRGPEHNRGHVQGHSSFLAPIGKNVKKPGPGGRGTLIVDVNWAALEAAGIEKETPILELELTQLPARRVLEQALAKKTVLQETIDRSKK
jgi:hypothetical protein